MSEHTKGKWEATAPDGSYHDVIRIYATGNESIPVAVCPQQTSPGIAIICGQTNETTEAACNARLIATAPDLLAAVIEARDVIRDYQIHHDDGEWCKELQESLLDTLEHAITEATGK